MAKTAVSRSKTATELPKRVELPPRQTEVLSFIEEFIDISGYPPSILEIADALGVTSTFGVRKHLDALVKKGFLTRGGVGLSRSVMPVRSPMASGGSIPVLGRVTAGAPILAVEHIEGWLAYKPASESRKVFALRVQGESMKDKGIMNGDYVICRQQATAENGDIIVALLDDSATVKTFRKKGKNFFLEPANVKFKNIEIDEDSGFSVIGKVTSVYRTLDERKPGMLQLRYT